MNWALSPDGKQVAVTESDKLDHKVRILNLQTGEQRELSTPTSISGGLIWSPDGGALYGAAQEKLRYSLVRLDLSGKTQFLLDVPFFVCYPVISPDGRLLAYSQLSHEVNLYILEHF